LARLHNAFGTKCHPLRYDGQFLGVNIYDHGASQLGILHRRFDHGRRKG